MKKVLVLGGSHYQIPYIKTAVKMGYHVITCDYLPNNPGHKFAHEYYNVSTTDKEAVFELARKIKIDAIIYTSDTVAQTAAYVCGKLNLPTNPYSSIEILTDKGKFRKFLKDNGFETPKAKDYSDVSDAIKEIDNFSFPLIVKPIDSGGSKGVAKLNEISSLKELAEHALSFSRKKRFIIEEFVEKDGYQISGNAFFVNGKIIFKFFADVHFSDNPVTPFSVIGLTFPSTKSENIQTKIHDEIQRVLTLLNMKTGVCSFDIILDKNENVFLIECGLDNSQSQYMNYAIGIDIVQYTIKAALEENCSDLKQVEPRGYYSTYAVYSYSTGVYREIWTDDNFRKNYLLKLDVFVNPGDKLEPSVVIGLLFLKFSNKCEMLEKMNDIKNLVKVISFKERGENQ